MYNVYQLLFCLCEFIFDACVYIHYPSTYIHIQHSRYNNITSKINNLLPSISYLFLNLICISSLFTTYAQYTKLSTATCLNFHFECAA